jgi:cytochrome oxidase Cu insertion factor (SCO1/SenC/PrrC family)
VRRLFSFAVLALYVASAQLPPSDPGPKPGTKFPPFALTDQHGKSQTLESLRGPKGLMLVFYRSADW